VPAQDQWFLKEFLLWGLVSYEKLNKTRTESGLQFKDALGSFIRGL
jgi:magnesium chelatase subunit I